jgi:peptide/nickel transport system substrate-binding protein
MYAVWYAVLNQLTEVSSTGDLVPLLAEAWEPSGDAAEWTFFLRKGVEFHNGKTLDADDVIASIRVHQGAQSKSSFKTFADKIIDIRKNDSHSLTFRLAEGNADFPYLLTAPEAAILPAKDGRVDLFRGSGTGSYVLESLDPGVSIKLRRNSKHFRADVGHFDTVDLLIVPDPGARNNALLANDVDAINRVDLKTVRHLEADDRFEILRVAGALHFDFAMRTDLAPFDNNDVRLALKFAIDREEMLQKILLGYGTLGNDHPISPAYRYWSAELAQRSHDPDQAKFHLKKAGVDRLQVALSTSDALFAGAMDSVVLFSENAKKAGIDIEVNRVSNDGYWSDVWRKRPFVASYWSGRATEDWMLSMAYTSGSDMNETFWSNQQVDELLKAGRSELDEPKRRNIYGEVQRLIRDEGGAIVPVFADHVMGLSKKVAHSDHIARNWDLDGFKFIERWWMA